MGRIGPEAIWRLATAIGSQHKTLQTGVTATVTRVDEDGKVWVTMPGSTTETPCDGITHTVTVGDTVNVDTTGNVAQVTGSTSNPSGPTSGLSQRIEAAKALARASKAAGEAARAIASQAREVASATGQHFWHRVQNTDGAGAGAFVTDVTREEFLSNVHAGVSGGFYDLGEPTETYRDSVTYEGDGETITFAMDPPTTDTSTIEVKVNGTVTTSYTADEDGITFSTAPSDGDTVLIAFDRAKRPWRNLLMNSLGILLRTGLFNLVSITSGAIAFFDGLGNTSANILALFGRDGAQIGYGSDYHSVVSPYNMSEVTPAGLTMFRVGMTVDSDGYREVTDSWTATGQAQSFALSFTDSNYIKGFWYEDVEGDYGIVERVFHVDSLTVEVDGTETDAYTIDGVASAGYYTLCINLSTTPQSGSTVTGTYRASKREIGMEMGEEVSATGRDSFAHGYGSKASGHGSHASGGYDYISGNIHRSAPGGTASGDASSASNVGTVAGYRAQTAIGKYNDNSSNNAFEIGNGTLALIDGQVVIQRSNAFEVDWDGNVTCDGVVVSGPATYGYLAGKFTYGRLAGR